MLVLCVANNVAAAAVRGLWRIMSSYISLCLLSAKFVHGLKSTDRSGIRFSKKLREKNYDAQTMSRKC